MKIENRILYFGLPIEIDNNVCIYQPTVKDLIDNKFELMDILEPFIVLDKQNFKGEKDNEKITNFDMFFVQIFSEYIKYLNEHNGTDEVMEVNKWIDNRQDNDYLVIKRLIFILKFLFKTDTIELHLSEGILEELNDNYIIINKSYKIDRVIYEEIKAVICKMFDTEIKIEEKREKSEIENEMDKLFAQKEKEYIDAYGEREKEGKNRDNLDIYTLMNYIIHYDGSSYNYKNVQELTIYQIKNTFKYYQSQETYKVEMSYRTSGNFKMDKKNTEHWFFDK